MKELREMEEKFNNELTEQRNKLNQSLTESTDKYNKYKYKSDKYIEKLKKSNELNENEKNVLLSNETESKQKILELEEVN